MIGKPLPPLTEEEKAEVEKHRPLVLFFVKTLARDKIPFRDQVNIGIFGLVKAIRKYNPSRKVKFSAYATQCVLNEIRRAEACCDLVRVPVNSQGKGKPDPPKVFFAGACPKAATHDDAMRDDQRTDDISKALWVLNDLEHEIVTLSVIYGWNSGDVGRQVNMDGNSARLMTRRALTKLRQALPQYAPKKPDSKTNPQRTNLAS